MNKFTVLNLMLAALALAFFETHSFAADDLFLNRAISIYSDGGRLKLKSSSRALYSGDTNTPTVTSVDKTSKEDGFFFAQLERSPKQQTPLRTYEFFRRSGKGVFSSSAALDADGEVDSFTTCDQWTGCVTVTKNLCNQVSGIFDKSGYTGPSGSFTEVTEKKLRECGGMMEYLLNIGELRSEEYQAKAAANYKAIYAKYRKELPDDAAYGDTTANFKRLFMQDPGRLVPHALKENRSKDYRRPAGNIDAFRGLLNIYATCRDKGHILGAKPIPNSAFAGGEDENGKSGASVDVR